MFQLFGKNIPSPTYVDPKIASLILEILLVTFLNFFPLNNDNYEDWIIYVLKGIEDTSKNTIELIKKIQEEMKSYKKEFMTKLPKIYSDELLDSLFFEVYTRINYIEDRCGVTRQTAFTYLNQLVDVGLLEYEKVGRESIYKNVRLINLLRKF